MNRLAPAHFVWPVFRNTGLGPTGISSGTSHEAQIQRDIAGENEWAASQKDWRFPDPSILDPRLGAPVNPQWSSNTSKEQKPFGVDLPNPLRTGWAGKPAPLVLEMDCERMVITGQLPGMPGRSFTISMHVPDMWEILSGNLSGDYIIQRIPGYGFTFGFNWSPIPGTSVPLRINVPCDMPARVPAIPVQQTVSGPGSVAPQSPMGPEWPPKT